MKYDLNLFIKSLQSHNGNVHLSYSNIEPRVLYCIIKYNTPNPKYVPYELYPFVLWDTDTERACQIFARITTKKNLPFTRKKFLYFILHSIARTQIAIDCLLQDYKGFSAILALIRYDTKNRVRNYCETLDNNTLDTETGRRLKRFLEWTRKVKILT